MPGSSSRQPTEPFVFLSVLVGFGFAMWAVKPFWDSASYDSLRAECTINLELIASRQGGIIPEQGHPLACSAWPAEMPNADGTAWDEVPPCWARLGFEPGLILHGQYVVEATNTAWTARCTLLVGEAVEIWQASNELTAHRVGD